jgi:hypothetical protein
LTEFTKRVLDRLARVGFEVREGSISPFGEELPLVAGVAWDRATAQFALVAHSPGEVTDGDTWRQLLFAASGLRHHLGVDGPSSFGTPLVLALVDEAGERVLRRLVEELANRYAIFSRVDLNLIRESDLADEDALDTALAPLLPCCRAMLGATISRDDVQRFWQVLRVNVAQAASELDPIFGDLRGQAADELADSLIGSSETETDRPAAAPVHWLELENFRSFAHARADFAAVTVVHGTNGSGKSSVLEGLELLWAGTSQRCPVGVPADVYAEHLPRSGQGAFALRGRLADASEDTSVDSVSPRPRTELQRTVLTQEAITALVNAPPDERYANLLAVTGLEVPELDPRTKRLVDTAKAEADTALQAASLPPLPRANVRGLDHIRGVLAAQFVTRLPGGGELEAAELALERAASGAYTARDWSLSDDVLDPLVRAEAEVDSLAAELAPRRGVASALEAAADALRAAAGPRREAARPLRQLVDSLATVRSPRPADESPPSHELSPALAARWMSHARTIRSGADRFRADADSLGDSPWAERLRAYAEALDAAADTTPYDDLERVARVVQPSAASGPTRIPEASFTAAGFRTVPAQTDILIPLLEELEAQLRREADAIESLAAELVAHPAGTFGDRSEMVLGAICRFELARHLRRARPIASASEELLRELLSGRLYPVVRELVAAMVRFEWYFEPLRLTVEGRAVVLGGLATPRTDLDARMLLNSAERTVVGLAWFLALHLLQPKDRRRVLVLDDPAGAFDAVNRAGFVATLRAFARLIRPEQIVVATHDETVATMLAEELCPVDGWPTAVVRVRCQRGEDDASIILRESVPEGPSDLAAEEAMLGLGGEPTLFGLR